MSHWQASLKIENALRTAYNIIESEERRLETLPFEVGTHLDKYLHTFTTVKNDILRRIARITEEKDALDEADKKAVETRSWFLIRRTTDYRLFTERLFSLNRRWHQWFWLRALVTWLALLAALYAALALPWFSKPTVHSPTSLAIYVLRDYLARVTGTLPLPCFSEVSSQTLDAQTGTTTTPGKASQQLKKELGWDGNGTPLLLRWFFSRYNFADGETPNACAWLRGHDKKDWADRVLRPEHVVAWISPDVGLIQKVTLLLFVSGWMTLGVARNDLMLTRGVIDGDRLPNLIYEDIPISLFPRRELVLTGGRETRAWVPVDEAVGAAATDPPQGLAEGADAYEHEILTGRNEVEDPFVKYAEGVTSVRQRLETQRDTAGSLLLRFVNYLDDIVGQGRSYDTKVRLADVANDKEAQFTGGVLDRFWSADYCAWILPTVGFLGTIYGISLSLVNAKGIVKPGGQGDPGEFGEVVDALGIAFDTTAFALLLLAFLMWRKMATETAMTRYSDTIVRDVRERLLDKLRGRPEKTDAGILQETNNLIDELRQRRWAADAQNPAGSVAAR